MMVRSILDWVDQTMEKSYAEEDDKKGFVLAAKAGAVEGAVDAAALWGSLLIAGCVVGIVKDLVVKK